MIDWFMMTVLMEVDKKFELESDKREVYIGLNIV